MTSVASIRLPKFHKIINALIWELAWKNRLVFPALLLALVLGAGLALALNYAPADVWWAKYVRGTAFVTFLGSVLLAFAPFTLMDSHGSWRMNSAITRWSVLPARTWSLVVVPLVVAWVVITLLVGAWTPILSRLFPGIDMVYVAAVFLTGAVAAQALAWAIPRKPSQYWVLAAMLFVTLILAVILPQESDGWVEVRSRTLGSLTGASVGLTLLALLAARRNRCSDWPGEAPLDRLCRLAWPSSNRTGVFRNRTAALFWSEVLPVCRAFLLTWFLLGLLVVGWGCLAIWLRRPGVQIPWPLIGMALLVEALPNFGVLCLMGWGLFLGCEPGMGCQTRLSGYRSTRPFTVGTLAGVRMSSVALIWLCVWVPLLVFQHLFLYGPLQYEEAAVFSHRTAEFMLGRLAFSANVMIAALPILLWGRLEGFPTLFLVTIVAWAWSCILGGFAFQEGPPDWVAWALGSFLFAKLIAASWLLLRSCRLGYVTWRFPAVLASGWLVVVGAILWLFSPWQTWGIASALGPIVMIPLVRLAGCPIAVAANRHR